jgi:YVTN family beta-propeller protein
MKKIAVILFLAFCTYNATAQSYKITSKIKISGDGFWDYLAVDALNNHLFVSHGNVVNVVDLKSNEVIYKIENTNGVHGIAVANDLNKAFISDGKDNAVTIVDLNTFQLIEKVTLEGKNPDAILYDSYSKKVFVYNGNSENATVLDAITNKLIKTITLGGKPEFSVTNEKGLVYVNIEDKNEIKIIDAKTLEVVKTWSILPGNEPSGLAIDLKNNKLFSVCANKLMIIIDAVTGKIMQKLPIGDGCDGVVFNEKEREIFTSNGEGTMTVLKENNAINFYVFETVKTKRGARTIALNKETGQLYTPTADFKKTKNSKQRPDLIPNSFAVLIIQSDKK